MRNALADLKILDFSRLLPGPYGTQILSDLGADVLKVESTRGGDYARYIPPLLGETGAMFHALNRNKKSLSIDLKNEKAGGIIRRLLGPYDILVESFRGGVMERLGLGYKDLRSVREDLIYLSLTGFGGEGSGKGRAGHDINFLAVTGMASVIGPPGHPPVIPGLQIADMTSGIFLALSLLAAVHKRQGGGEGSHVDLSMADCTLSMMSVLAVDAPASKDSHQPGGGVLAGQVLCYNYYETKDGRHMAVGALEPNFWKEVCRALEAPDLLDEGFSQTREDLAPFRRLKDIFRSKTQEEWTAVFEKFDACVEPVLFLSEALSSRMFSRRGAVGSLKHSGEKPVTMVDSPIQPEGCRNAEAGPVLGENTRETLTDLGYGDPEIEALFSEGVVAGP